MRSVAHHHFQPVQPFIEHFRELYVVLVQFQSFGTVVAGRAQIAGRSRVMVRSMLTQRHIWFKIVVETSGSIPAAKAYSRR